MKMLLDIYFNKDNNTITKWIKNKNKVFPILETFYPKIYATGCSELKSKLESLPYIKNIHIEKKRTWPKINLESVMCIEIEQKELYNTSKMLETRGCTYNVDIGPVRKYIIENDIFPFAKLKNFWYNIIDDDKNLYDYELPDVKCCELSISSKEQKIMSLNSSICKISLGNIIIDGKNESEVIEEFYSEFIDQNIDLILTNSGDGFELPFLYHRASLHGIRLQLGREKERINNNGKTYFSYGRIYYKPNGFYLSGRLHIDKSSFLFREGGLLGLIDLSRIAEIPLQELSRLSPGSVITALQINAALRDNILIPWKRNIAENWKTAEKLLIADRGALTIEPKVGLHEDIWELDFSSMFPNIMLNHNISPETVLCDCCSESSERVPFINYNICEKNIGLIPNVLRPLLGRRAEYKKRMKTDQSRSEEYTKKQNVLKWLLVTSFGYMGFNKARFGRIECYESVTAYARDILLRTIEIADDMGYDVIHGIVDCIWVKGPDPEKLCEIITKDIGIDLELKGLYNWIVFLPNKQNGSGSLNRYYGAMNEEIGSGKLKVRGIEMRQGSTPNIIRNLQDNILNKLAEAKIASEFYSKIPEAISILKEYTRKVFNNECQLSDLIFEIRISKNLNEYKGFNNQVATLRQLKDRGINIQPGQSIYYIISDHKSKDYQKRVIVPELSCLSDSNDKFSNDKFSDHSIKYDKEKYYQYLLRATESILLPFGYSVKSLDEIINNKIQTKLHQYDQV